MAGRRPPSTGRWGAGRGENLILSSPIQAPVRRQRSRHMQNWPRVIRGSGVISSLRSVFCTLHEFPCLWLRRERKKKILLLPKSHRDSDSPPTQSTKTPTSLYMPMDRTEKLSALNRAWKTLLISNFNSSIFSLGQQLALQPPEHCWDQNSPWT